MTESPDILTEIHADVDDACRRYRGQALPSTLLKELADASAGDLAVQQFLATFAETPSKVLEQLAAESQDEAILALLAAHPRTPRTVLRDLIEKGSEVVRETVAANRLVSPQVAAGLTRDPSSRVRIRLAANPGAPMRVLVDLASDPDPAVRGALLKQKQLDYDVLEKLLNDPDPLVQARTVMTAPLPDRLPLEWADADDEEQQALLLLRKDLGDAVLESLCFSPHRDIQLAALQRRVLYPDELLGWAENGSPEIRCLIAADISLPEEIQVVIAGDAEAAVRTALAGNPSLKEEPARRLLHDPEPAVLAALASNPYLAETVVLTLAQLNHPEISAALATRPDLPKMAVRWFIEHSDDTILYLLAAAGNLPPRLPVDLAQRLALHRLPSIRKMAANAIDIDRNLQARLARDPATVVRQTLAANPGLARPILEFLANDPNPDVAKTAQEKAQSGKGTEAQSGNAGR
jgi:phage tail protein X